MVEFKIEKKQPVWSWILGILLLVLAVYLLFFRDHFSGTNETATTMDTVVDSTVMQDEAQSIEDPSDVAAFVAFVKIDDGNRALGHEYSNDALNKLIDATEEVTAKLNVEAKMDLESARQHAGRITSDPEATNHADYIKMATDKISTVLQNIQATHFSNLKAEADKVKMSSQAINVKVLTLDQKDNIKGFFDNAADLLQKVNK